MQDSYDYDLFVVGAGSGGVRAARVAAAHGARVAIAEEDRYGGTCVIRGCIPKKLLVYAASFKSAFDHARHYGWTVAEPAFDWASLIAAKDREIARLEGVYQRLLDEHGVTRLHARAILADPHTVLVEGRRITARVILLATGSRPHVPDLPGAPHVLTSNDVFELRELPRHLTVVGGGYIAVELASIFRGMGRQVTLVYRGAHLLRGFDHDIRRALTDAMVARGIDVCLNTDLGRVNQDGSGCHLELVDGTVRDTDAIVYATGRRPNTRGLGLEECGVELGSRGEVVVSELSQSSVESIYAVGDCTDRVTLTPAAIREGQAFADSVFGGRPTPVRYRDVPTAVFSLPPVGAVGMSEDEACARYGNVDVYRSEFRPLALTLTGDTEKTMMKIIVAPGHGDRVVGIHMVGADAPEIVQAAAIAMTAGASKADFDATLAIHPSTAEELVLMRTKVLAKRR